MNAPIVYWPDFVEDPAFAFASLRKLDWERRGDAPRCEYYCNDHNVPYVYGRGRGVREYKPRPYDPVILEIRKKLEEKLNTSLDVCFLNLYLTQSDHLGWHADDSPEMDDARPIVTVSLGAEREIWFRQYLKTICSLCTEEVPNHKTVDCRGPELAKNQTIRLYTEEERLKLKSGSACVMSPGMQDGWEHRIPKSSHKVGERISLTFRGYVRDAGSPSS